jgi:branched-chain amino acid transport system permease protein
VLLSELTKAWLLYLGLVFLFMVMYAPGGVASLIMMNLRVAAFRQAAPLWVSYLALAGTALVALAGRGRHDRDGLPPAAQRGLGPELTFMGACSTPRGSTAGSAPSSCC